MTILIFYRNLILHYTTFSPQQSIISIFDNISDLLLVVGGYLLLVICYSDLPTNKQPPTTNKQPPTTNKQPTTNNQQQIYN